MRAFFILSAFALCLLAGCVRDDELVVKRSTAGPHTVPEHLKSLLERHPEVRNATKQLECQRTLLFDHADLVAGSDGTVSYRLPYLNNVTGQVEGCLTYRTDDDLLFGTAPLPARLSMPQDFTPDVFHSLPAGQRYLASAWFKVLRRKGLDVADVLTATADSVNAAEREKLRTAAATRGLVYNPSAIDYVGDHLRIEIIYGMVPLVSAEGDYEFYVRSLTREYRQEVALDFVNACFPYAEYCQVDLMGATCIWIDVCCGRYLTQQRIDMLVPGLVNALADAYVDAGLEAFFYSYEYYAYFCQLPKPELWTVVEDNPRQGGGGYSGRGDYDDEAPDTPQPSDSITKLKESIITTIVHENFIGRLDSAGLHPKLWLGEIDFEVDLNPSGKPSNGGYFQQSNQLVIGWEAMRVRGYTIADKESCVFHECVHAKQDFVDKIELEFDENGNIKREPYEIYYTKAMVEEEVQFFEEWFLSVYPSPNEGDPNYDEEKKIHEERYKFYYDYHGMDDIEKMYKEQIPLIKKYNKENTKMEIEAYELQLYWYGKYMSPKYREKMESQLQSLKDIYEQIKDQ